MKKYPSLLIAFVFLNVFLGCKKDVKEPDDPFKLPQTSTIYDSDPLENLIKDSVFYYTKLFSLWQDNLPPKNLNDLQKENYIHQNYTRYFERAEHVLDWMVSIPKDAKGKAIDRFSFLDREGIVSDEIQDALATSFGMHVFYLETDESIADGDDAYLYIRMVDKNSSADAAGLERGDRIFSINGDLEINYNAQQATGFQQINDYLYKQSNLNLQVVKSSGGAPVPKAITSAQYNMDPILDHRVIPAGDKQVGYLAFSSFVSIDNPTTFQRFKDVFDDFQSQGINELVVDLRYNGGGSTLTAEYLVDRIVPASANGKLMYRYEINSFLKSQGWQRGKDAPFLPVYIEKKGTLNIPRVYFLVTKASASASELLINTLKPYMSVYMIGTYSYENGRQVAENTYGKPAGFFAWEIVNGVDLYATSFKMYNAQGQGDYFDGLVPNTHVWEFAPGKFLDFGDPDESMLSAALNHIKNGSFGAKSSYTKIASSGKVLTSRARARDGIQEDTRLNNMFKFNDSKVKLR